MFDDSFPIEVSVSTTNRDSIKRGYSFDQKLTGLESKSMKRKKSDGELNGEEKKVKSKQSKDPILTKLCDIIGESSFGILKQSLSNRAN